MLHRLAFLLRGDAQMRERSGPWRKWVMGRIRGEPWMPKVPEGRLQISVNYGDVFHVPVNASVAYWFG